MSEIDNIKAAISSFWHADFVPWIEAILKGAAKAEVAALLPIASSAAGALAADLATNSNNLSKFAATASSILTNTAQQAEAASIQAGGASLLLAVNTAIAAHAGAVPLGGTSAPPIPPSDPAA